MQRFKSWPVGVRIGVGGVLVAILFSTLTAMFQGIIGNGSYALSVLLWPYVQTHALIPLWGQILKTIMVGSWPLFAIIIILLGILGYTLAYARKRNIALNMTSEIVTFDTILLNCLAGLAAAKDQGQREQKMKKILRVLLKNAMSSRAASGCVFRASVLLPDSADPQYLRIWGCEGMSPENIRRTAFYIGDDMKIASKEQGVAGETYKDGRTRIAHMVKKDDKWECEHRSYRHFENRTYSPYKAFVCTPAVKVTLERSGEDKRKTIGVVCFDSYNKWIFDSPQTQRLLKSFSERVGEVISLYWELGGG